MNPPRKTCGGITFTDAAIVAAMLALLAAIAAPTLSDARQRADTAAVKDDFRRIATALESYKIDQSAYIRMSFPGGCLNANPGADFAIFERLTTPVSYIGTPPPFYDRYEAEWLDRGNLAVRTALTDALKPLYFYIPRNTTTSVIWLPSDADPLWYILESAGPDKMRHSITEFLNSSTQQTPTRGAISSRLIYDPTNGLASVGSIWHAGGEITGSGSQFGHMIQALYSSKINTWHQY